MHRQTAPRRARAALAAAFAAALIAALPAVFAAAPARADQTDAIVFGFSLHGLPAGTLSLNGRIQGGGYGVSGVVATDGLLGALARIRYDATANGAFAAGKFAPATFQERAQRGSRASSQSIRFRNGTPASVQHDPPRAPRSTDVDPSAQTGAIDPLTALYAVLRDVDRDEACRFASDLYDGSKRTHVALSAPRPDGQGVTCSGEYRRVAGFSARDMAEKTVFPFTLTYRPAPNDPGRLQVYEIVTDTILGKGRLTRQ